MAPNRAFQDWQAWITEQIIQGRKQRDVYHDLKSQGVSGGYTSFESRLREWGVKSRAPSVFTITGIETTIEYLFYTKLCSDKEICLLLEAGHPGHKASRRTLRRFRREKGWIRRTIPSHRAAVLQRIEILLDEELKQGHLEDHGRHLLHTFMKRKYGSDLPIGEYVFAPAFLNKAQDTLIPLNFI